MTALFAIVLVQCFAVAGAWLLRVWEPVVRRYLPLLVSLAVGVMLATSVLHLLPEALEALGDGPLVWRLLGGTLLGLFFVERVMDVVMGEAEVDGGHHHGTTPRNILAASVLHSFVDGTALATAFTVSERLGWVTAGAIALHEVPHRMGDYALFVHLKVPARRALWMTVVAGLPAVLGVGVVWLVGVRDTAGLAWLLPVSAGSFLYVALVNLLPEMRREQSGVGLAAQMASLLGGVGLVMAAAGVVPF